MSKSDPWKTSVVNFLDIILFIALIFIALINAQQGVGKQARRNRPPLRLPDCP